jgi:protein-S-isoprenylcysteine O-methyltransferase Ste14
MKEKIISTIIFVVLAYILPLSGRIEFLGTIQAFILAASAGILFFTQPPLKLTEVKQDQRNDKLSVVLIISGCLICQVASVIEWAYYRRSSFWSWDWQTVTGLALLAGGTIFRVWCIRTLGKFFTTTVKTQEKQHIVRSGAYSIVRHPSYLGAYLALAGSSLFLHAIAAMILTSVLMFLVYVYRINAEETALTETFGDEYTQYRKDTNRLIPFIY